MSNIPVLYLTSDSSPDIKIGTKNFGSASALPVPIPPELDEEFSGNVEINNVDIYRNNNFRVLNYSNAELFSIDASGNSKTAGTFQVNGNQIKSSGGTTAIELSGANVQLKGTVQITGAISSPTGTNSVAGNLTIVGSVAAGSKLFDIPHPTKEGMRLRHGTLEGPEHSVFVRGKTSTSMIYLPDYWFGLVDINTITVMLTPTSTDQHVSVVGVVPYQNTIGVSVVNSRPWCDYHYFIVATRKDVPSIEVEYAEA